MGHRRGSGKGKAAMGCMYTTKKGPKTVRSILLLFFCTVRAWNKESTDGLRVQDREGPKENKKYMYIAIFVVLYS